MAKRWIFKLLSNIKSMTPGFTQIDGHFNNSFFVKKNILHMIITCLGLVSLLQFYLQFSTLQVFLCMTSHHMLQHRLSFWYWNKDNNLGLGIVQGLPGNHSVHCWYYDFFMITALFQLVILCPFPSHMMYVILSGNGICPDAFLWLVKKASGCNSGQYLCLASPMPGH